MEKSKPKKPIEGKVFDSGERVVLDRMYSRCSFDRCHLVFTGGLDDVNLPDCTISPRTTLALEGNGAFAISLLRAFWAVGGGARGITQSYIEIIRGERNDDGTPVDPFAGWNKPKN